MSIVEFQLCSECNDCSYCYDAISVINVSLSLFRDIFQFKTTDISNNTLPSAILSDPMADISYNVISSLYPEINPAHTMMDHTHSLNALILNGVQSYSNLIKHDFVRYIGYMLFNTPHATGLFTNITEMKDEIEVFGWNNKVNIETILSNCYNAGNGLSNSDISNSNITRNIMLQIAEKCIERLDVSTNGIIDTVDIQPVPFIEGDTINYLFSITPSPTQHILTNRPNPIPKRTYKITILLTDNITNLNTIPTDSVSDQNHATVVNYGVPQVSDYNYP